MSGWNYLKTAFWQRVPLPLLGRVPLNAVALAGFGINNQIPTLASGALGFQGSQRNSQFRLGLQAAPEVSTFGPALQQRPVGLQHTPDSGGVFFEQFDPETPQTRRPQFRKIAGSGLRLSIE